MGGEILQFKFSDTSHMVSATVVNQNPYLSHRLVKAEKEEKVESSEVASPRRTHKLGLRALDYR